MDDELSRFEKSMKHDFMSRSNVVKVIMSIFRQHNRAGGSKTLEFFARNVPRLMQIWIAKQSYLRAVDYNPDSVINALNQRFAAIIVEYYEKKTAYGGVNPFRLQHRVGTVDEDGNHTSVKPTDQMSAAEWETLDLAPGETTYATYSEARFRRPNPHVWSQFVRRHDSQGDGLYTSLETQPRSVRMDKYTQPPRYDGSEKWF
jgi:hypothetical protein